MSNYDDEFNSPPRRNKRDPITGKALPSNSSDTISKSSESFSDSLSKILSDSQFSRSSEQIKHATYTRRKQGTTNKGISHAQGEDALSASPETGFVQQKKTATRIGKTLLMRGIDYLSRREHSAYELRRKLAPYADSEEELEATLQRLQKENWQNDERFMRNFAHAKQARWGSAKVLHALASHQLEPENLEGLREQLRETEYDRALEVYQGKFRTALNEVDDYQREYARRVRFMLSRGFNAEVVRKVLKAPTPNEE